MFADSCPCRDGVGKSAGDRFPRALEMVHAFMERNEAAQIIRSQRRVSTIENLIGKHLVVVGLDGVNRRRAVDTDRERLPDDQYVVQWVRQAEEFDVVAHRNCKTFVAAADRYFP